MIDREELSRKIKLITQDAWSVGTNTTVNSMIEYIVKQSLFVVLDELEKELEDASKDGGLQESQGHTKAPNKRIRVSPQEAQSIS